MPAAILWFGIQPTASYFVVLLGSVPSIANGMLAGVDQIPPVLLRVGTVLGAGRFASARHILLVGIGVELLVFRPLERSVLRSRGFRPHRRPIAAVRKNFTARDRALTARQRPSGWLWPCPSTSRSAVRKP